MDDNTGSGPQDPYTKTDPTQPPPTYLPQWDNIPDLLKQLPRWVLWSWRWNESKGKWDKPPLTQKAAGHIVNASTTNRAHWMSYGAAKTAVEQGLAMGVGFVLTNEPVKAFTSEPVEMYILGIDGDACRDPRTGQLTEWSRALMQRFEGNYCEISPSSTGIKFLTLSRKPLPGRGKRDNVRNTEIYDRGRYFCVTGLAFEGYADLIDNTATVQQLYAELGNEGDKGPGERELSDYGAEPIPANWEEANLVDPFGLHWNERALALLQGDGTGDRSSDAYSLAKQAIREIGDYPAKILRFMMHYAPEAALARRSDWDSAAAWMWHYTVVPALADHRALQTVAAGARPFEVIEGTGAVSPVGVIQGANEAPAAPQAITYESVEAEILRRDPGDRVGVQRLITRIAQGNFALADEVPLCRALAGSCDLTLAEVKKLVKNTKADLRRGLKAAGAEGSVMPQSGGGTQLMPWDRFPDTKVSEGRIEAILSTTDNIEALLAYYGIEIWRDAYTHYVDFRVPDTLGIRGKVTDIYTLVFSLLSANQAGKEQYDKHVTEIADRRERNRVLEYLKGLPAWDQQNHIRALADTLQLEDGYGGHEAEIAKVEVLFRWLVQACAATDQGRLSPRNGAGKLLPGYEGMLVFRGHQGIGKTRWIRGLLPEQLQEYVRDGVMLDPSDKDSVHKATRGWIAELGELDSTFRKADVSRLKAFLSERSDTMRMPYERLAQTWPRRTVFAGTVNDDAFLNDPTGARRYWVLPVGRITQPEDAAIDLDQVWAHAWQAYRSGAPWWLLPQEEARVRALRLPFDGVQHDPVIQSLLETFGDFESPEVACQDTWWTATEIARQCGVLRPTQSDLKKINAWLRQHWEVQSSGLRRLHRRVQQWRVPHPRTSHRFENQSETAKLEN